MHEFFQLPNEVGFTSVLLGASSIADAIRPVPGHERLFFLSAGPSPPNPSELLSHQRTLDLFTALKGQFDIVLVDSPPVLPVTDAAVLSRVVDGTLVVAQAGATSRQALRAATTVLDQVGAPIIGYLLNAVLDQEHGYAHYRYDYGPIRTGDEPTNGSKPRRTTPVTTQAPPAPRGPG